MVRSSEPFTEPSGAAGVTAKAKVMLAVVTVAATIAFLGLAALDYSKGAGTAPRMLDLVLILPPVTAAALALRLRRALRSDFVARGQFTSVGGIFTFTSLLGVGSAVGDWDLPLWILGAASGIATLALLQRPDAP